MRQCMKPLCQQGYSLVHRSAVRSPPLPPVGPNVGALRQLRTFRKSRANAKKNCTSNQHVQPASTSTSTSIQASSVGSDVEKSVENLFAPDNTNFPLFEALHQQESPDDDSPGLSRFHASDLFLHTSSATVGWSNAWVEETDSDDAMQQSASRVTIDEAYLSASDADTTDDADGDSIWVKPKSPSGRPFLHIPSKEELNRHVQLSIEHFLPANVRNMPTRSFKASDHNDKNITGQQSEDTNYDIESLTPAQQFYRENKDVLLHRAQRHFAEKHDAACRKRDAMSQEEPRETDDEDALFNKHFNGTSAQDAAEKEWDFYRDPVVRPPKGHAWDFGDVFKPLAKEDLDFQIGKMPSVEQIVKFLRQEAVTNIAIVDLEEAGRRDLGSYAIIGTCKTTRHCHKTAKRVCHTVKSLDIPFISASTYCWGSRGDAWITSHCGPLKIHCLTTEERAKLELERFWANAEESRVPGDFAAYTDQEILPDAASPHVLDHRFSMMKRGAPVPEVLEAKYESLKRNDDYRSPTHPATTYFDAELGRVVQVPSLRGQTNVEAITVESSADNQPPSIISRTEEDRENLPTPVQSDERNEKAKRRNR